MLLTAVDFDIRRARDRDGGAGSGRDRTDLTGRCVGGGANPHATNKTFDVDITNVVPPAKPTGLTATAGDGGVVLLWADPGNSAISGYQYRQQSAGGDFGSWLPTDESFGDNSATIGGLTNGSEYRFQIRALVGAVPGAASDTVSATPSSRLGSIRPAPTGFTATAGDGEVTLTWDYAGSGSGIS